MDKTKSQIAKDACKGLSIEELQNLRSFISGLIAQGPTRSEATTILTASNHDDWVLMGIADYMRKTQLDLSGIAQLTAGKHYQTYKQKLPALKRFLKNAGNQTMQRAMLRLGVGLLHENLIELGFPVSTRTMMANIHRIASVINQQFPGYAQSGMLAMIIRSEIDVRQKHSKRPIQHGRTRA